MAGNRFLSGIFERKAAGDSTARAAGAALTTAGMPLPASTGNWDMQVAVSRGLERVSMVFRCVDAISQTQARIPMVLTKMEPNKARTETDSVDDVDLWKLLNFRPNSYETAAQFRYRVSATLLLSRRGAFIEMVREGGKVTQLHLLLPGSVMPIPDAKNFVSGYEIARGDSVTDKLKKEDVCWIKSKPHPMDPYSQLTPLMAAGLSAETDLLARTFNRNFLSNDGRPGMLVTVQGKLNREDAAEVKSRFSGGISQAGRTTVLEADGIQAQDMSASPRDLQWSELITGSKEDIQLAFGVPESVMGNASGRTFDNADAERENFYIDTMQPHCDAVAMGLDPITGDTEDDVVVAFDYSGIDVLQRIAARKREEWRTEVGAGLKTIDEYREAIGSEVLSQPGSRVLFQGNGLVIAKDEADRETVSKYTPIGGQPPADPSAQAASGAQQGVEAGFAEANRQTGNTNAAAAIRDRARNLSKQFGDDLEHKSNRAERQQVRTKRKRKGNPLSTTMTTSGPGIKVHPYLSLRYKMEGFVEGQLTQWDLRQENVVAERLGHAKFRKGTRHWEAKEGEHVGELKALDPSYAIDPEQWTDDLVSGMGAFIRTAMLREAKTAALDMRDRGIENISDLDLSSKDNPLIALFGSQAKAEAAMDGAYGAVLQIIRDAAKNQTARLQKAIEDMDADGASIKDIERKVRQMTGTRAPWRKQLAINVTTTAVEAARERVYAQSPRGTFTKTWNSAHDSKVRPSHVKADGQTKAAHVPFRVGKSALQFPCDPAAPIEEVANCRCYATYTLSDRAANALDGY